MKHLVIPMLLAAQAFTSMQVYAQQAKPVVPAQVLSQLPPPPPVLDPQLRKDLRASQKLDDDQAWGPKEIKEHGQEMFDLLLASTQSKFTLFQ